MHYDSLSSSSRREKTLWLSELSIRAAISKEFIGQKTHSSNGDGYETVQIEFRMRKNFMWVGESIFIIYLLKLIWVRVTDIKARIFEGAFISIIDNAFLEAKRSAILFIREPWENRYLRKVREILYLIHWHFKRGI